MQTYRIQEIYRDRDLDLVLITASSIYVDILRSSSANSSYYGHIQPVWLVIHDSTKTIALDMKAEHVHIGQLYHTVPELKKHFRENL